jgi:hypothetical protein
MGVAAVRNCHCRSSNVRTGFLAIIARLFGWTRIEAPAAKRALTLVKTFLKPPNFSTQKKLLIRPPRVFDLPRCGAARKRNWAENGSCIEQKV